MSTDQGNWCYERKQNVKRKPEKKNNFVSVTSREHGLKVLEPSVVSFDLPSELQGVEVLYGLFEPRLVGIICCQSRRQKISD